MKTFKLIGMALLFFATCVNFAACSSDDEPEGDKEIENQTGKKISTISISYHSYGSKDKIAFLYNKKGLLSQVIIDGYSATYEYQDNLITITSGNKKIKAKLSNSRVELISTDNESLSYKYDKKGYLISADDETTNFQFIWKDSNLSEVDYIYAHEQYHDFFKQSYSSNTNFYGFMALFAGGDNPYAHVFGDIDEILFLFVAHPNLFGQPCKNGISQIEMTDAGGEEHHGDHLYFSFEYDKKEYPTYVMEKKDNIDHTTYNITWE